MSYQSEPAGGWFFDWLTSHQELHGSKAWIPVADERAVKFYEGWIEAFNRWHISKDDAYTISKRLQEEASPHPDKQLAWIKDAYFTMHKARREAKGVQAEESKSGHEITATERSEGCPECTENSKATGYAKRRLVIAGFPWAMKVDLYCRCPLGRYFEQTAPDRNKGSKRDYSDLQLLMDVWDGTLNHHSWDWSEPKYASYHPQTQESHYMTPRESAAYKMPKRAQILRRVFRSAVEAAQEPFVPASSS